MVEYTYDAWGNIIKEKSNVTPSYATVKAFNPFRYRGYVYDTDTGLYYLQSRYYDPTTGRFVNADDTAYVDTNSGTPLSTNMFAYCENNHINKTDPNGCYNIKNFNCYAYAFGISNKWLTPGNDDWRILKYYKLTTICNLVLKDFSGRVRKLNGRNAKLKKGEYRIAMRLSYIWVQTTNNFPIEIVYDFHFWKQDPKTLKWWNKHGIGNIKLIGKINADKNKGSGWTALARGCVDPYVLYRFGGMLYKTTVIGPLYYNSKTLYFAYKGRFWSK